MLHYKIEFCYTSVWSSFLKYEWLSQKEEEITKAVAKNHVSWMAQGEWHVSWMVNWEDYTI